MSELTLPPARATKAPSRAFLLEIASRDRALGRVLRAVVDDVVDGGVDVLPQDGEYDLVVVSTNGLSPTLAVCLDRYGQPTSRSRLLICMPGASDDELVLLFNASASCNLMAKNDGELNIDELIVTVRKITTGEVFGLDKYFVWGIGMTRFTLQSSAQKPDLLACVDAFASDLRLPRRVTTLLCTVADELATNALYNAPLNADGTHRYAHLHRNADVVLDEEERIEIQICSDGRRIGISASDPFGSLEPQRVLTYLAKCLRRDVDQVDKKPGGAGLGLYYIFDAVSHFIVNIDPGKRTEMIGLIDVTGGYKGVAARAKSFNLFLRGR